MPERPTGLWPRPPAWRLVKKTAAIGAFAVVLLLAIAGSARAAHWTDVPFPSGEIAQAVVEDSAGNIWASTIIEDGSFGHVEVLWSGAEGWEDACPGLDWTLSPWSNGLISVGDKLFLATSDGGCFERSAGDLQWHKVDTSLQFVRFTEWDGYVWSGSDYLGAGRLDPGTEQTEMVSDGLVVVMDNPGAARAYRNPRGNDDYLYVGCTVSPEMAAAPDFQGVTVYRLARGSTTWEDTGLNVMPQEGDLDYRGSAADAAWGVWNVVAMKGYVLCQVLAQVADFNARCFLYNEQDGSWTPVTMPASETGWYFLASGEPCFVRDGEFYFPTGFVSNGVVCDVLDPKSHNWREDVTVKGISWRPLANTAQVVGGELLVAYSEDTGTGTTTDDSGTGAKEPSFVESVPLPTEISTDPGVIGTNFGLALLFALVFAFTSTLFNSTLKANHERITRAFSPLGRGAQTLGRATQPLLRRFGNWAKAFTFRSGFIRGIASRSPHVGTRWLQPTIIVIVAALVYAFLDPTFGFSAHGTNIFFSLAISIAIITATYDGIQALTSSRGYHIPAGLRLFPAAIVIAVLCVILSRTTHFSPGYLYGFVGSLAFLGAQQPEERKKGHLVLVGAVCLLAVSLAAWFLAIPVAESAAADSWWAPFVQSICSATFVAGLQGLLFGLLPLSVMDGGSVFQWSKVVWAILFGIVIFLFWHVLLNKGSKYGSAFEQTNTQVVLVLLGFWTLVTVGVYLAFRKPRPKPPAGMPVGPYPEAWGQPQGSWGQQPGAWGQEPAGWGQITQPGPGASPAWPPPWPPPPPPPPPPLPPSAGQA